MAGDCVQLLKLLLAISSWAALRLTWQLKDSAQRGHWLKSQCLAIPARNTSSPARKLCKGREHENERLPHTELWCSVRVGREHGKGGKFAWEWRWPVKDIQLQGFSVTKKTIDVTWKKPAPSNSFKFNTLSISLSIPLFLGGHQLPLEPYFL